MQKHDKVVFVGSSTGGPRALITIIPQLPPDLSATIIIVPHMLVGFTRSLADRLESTSSLAIKEADPGDTLEIYHGLVAPGGFHMSLAKEKCVSPNQNPPVQGVRPAVDVTMNTVAQHY